MSEIGYLYTYICISIGTELKLHNSPNEFLEERKMFRLAEIEEAVERATSSRLQ